MSRIKRFTHSLLSGYVLLAANILFTLASVPLALRYLSKEEFGLWALVMQMANFNMILVDLGMSSALSRVLIDHKDDKKNSTYGSVIQTGFLVLIVQAVFIVVVGSVISVWLPEWMKVPDKFWTIFRALMIWQCVAMGFAFVGRIFGYILSAHQRYDVCNYATIGGLAANLAGLWIGFHFQQGLYSMLWAFVAGMVVNIVGPAWAVCRLKLLPERGNWGRPSRSMFRELFFYGTDLFLISIGQQLIAASQVPVVTRTLGLEAAAVWSVAVKVFVLAQQVVYRIFDFSYGALAEMIVRGERERLKMRFRDVVILTGSVAAAAGLLLALCNQSFLNVWTRGRISWSPVNDWLMAVSFFIYASTRVHIGFVGVTKQIGAMKFIYFIEGAVFVGLALLSAGYLGFAGIIASGIVTNLIFSGVYGVRRTTDYFKISYAGLLREWLGRPLALLLAAGAAALLLWLAIQGLNAPLQLALSVGVFGGAAFLLFWSIGMTAHVRKEATALLRRTWPFS
jgi:O-antigen/teichoic acid export membrane protein